MPTEDLNVLFVMSDQHSFRCLSHRPPQNGGESVHTPTLDALAESSAQFENAYCSTPVCTPSRLSLLTGREVQDAGAWANDSLLKPELRTLPETLSGAGYETCLVGKMHLGGNRQFAGFDHRPYGDLTGHSGHQADPPDFTWSGGLDWKSLITDVGVTNVPESLLQEQTIVQEAHSFLREHRHQNPDQPWFLCTSFSRPHWPRTAPRRHFERYWPDGVTSPPVGIDTDTAEHPLSKTQASLTGSREVSDEETMRARAAYFACVDYLDEILGDFLSTLDRNGFLENTIVIYASDHGELAGEHGLWEKYTYHEASTRVPLFIQLPEHREGDHEPTRFETPVSLIDLYPTLCGLIDTDVPDGLDGMDLSTAISRGEKPDRGPIFVDCFDTNGTPETDYRMVRRGDYKYVKFRSVPELLFNLDADPLEQHNLAPDAEGRDAEALVQLRELVTETMDFEDASRKRERDQARKEEYQLGAAGGTNQYHFPDGRIVNADTIIERPDLVTEKPDVAFDDYPENEK